MEKLNTKKMIVGGVITFLSLFLVMYLIGDLIDIFELKTLDLRFQIRDKFKQNPDFTDDIVFVNIDNYSKEKSGLTLWPKKYYADVINKIAEKDAEIVAVDILFGNTPDTLGNSSIVKAISNAGNVISPYVVNFSEDYLSESLDPEIYNAFAFDINPDVRNSDMNKINTVLYYPIQKIIEQSLALGFVNVEPDFDGVLRRISVVSSYNNKLTLSFFFQSVCSFLDYPIENIAIINQKKIVLQYFPINNQKETITLPLDENGNLIINYAGSMFEKNIKNSYSAWDLLNSTSKDISFKGKIVILSDISTAAKDYFPTPYDKVLWNSFIFANAMNTILSDQTIHKMPDMYSLIFLIVFSILIIIFCIKIDNLWFNISSILLLVLFLIINVFTFVFLDFIIPFFPVFIPLFGIYLFLSIYKFHTTEMEKVKLESRLRSYLSPILMDRIKKNPEILKVGGEKKYISIIFTDIVNFTKFCDEWDPTAVQEVLKEYYGKGAKLVFKHNGIVDKYLGDGLLAFFENDDPNKPSQISAAKCALEFQQMAKELAKHFNIKFSFDFQIRVGISTGFANVGNIGPVEKTDYTIIGSVVNLASRLQSHCEPGGIIIDDWTKNNLTDEFKFEQKQDITDMKGYEGKRIKAYEIISDKVNDIIN